MNLFLLTITIDAQTKGASFTEFSEKDWSTALLKLFVKNISKEGKLLMGGDEWRLGEFCQWNGILCHDHNVHQIRCVGNAFRYWRYGNFKLTALPNTTERIFIDRCNQNFKLNTRGLPRELRILSLIRNAIRGRLDLTTLPARLQQAELSWNRLRGPVILTNLPHSLCKLSIQGNPIHQGTVWYDNLPAKLQLVKFPEFDIRRGVDEDGLYMYIPRTRLIEKKFFKV